MKGFSFLFALGLFLMPLYGCGGLRFSRLPRPELRPIPPRTQVAEEVEPVAPEYIWPVNHPARKVSSGYGPRPRKLHKGVDITAPLNVPVMAVRDGTVTFSGRNGAYGLIIVVDHGGGWETAYAHLSERLVGAGDRVQQGQVIGRVGRTGNATTTHVHFEVRQEGRPIDPMPFLTAE